MGDLHHDPAGVRLEVPAGWQEVDPADTAVRSSPAAVQVIALADWDGDDGVRPTMSLSLVDPAPEHVATRVLTDARASGDRPHLVSVDPWPVPGTSSSGRRLVLADARGDGGRTTVVWVAGTADADVVVTAYVESGHLHVHEAELLEAVAGVDLREAASRRRTTCAPEDASPTTAELASVVPRGPWQPDAAEAPAILADPDSRILVEASVASSTLSFDATLVGDQATVRATASPGSTGAEPPTDDAAADAAGDAAGDAARAGTSTFRVPAAHLTLAIARWLGLGPTELTPARPVTIPIRVLMSRLVDPSVPAPDGVDPTTWEEPWFLWTLRSSATDSGLVMVDTGATGQYAVMETADEHTTRFAPLSSYSVWLTMNWLVSESLGHR